MFLRRRLILWAVLVIAVPLLDWLLAKRLPNCGPGRVTPPSPAASTRPSQACECCAVRVAEAVTAGDRIVALKGFGTSGGADRAKLWYESPKTRPNCRVGVCARRVESITFT